MADWHIPWDMMRRFHRAELSREELRAVTRHLLTECPICRELSQAAAAERSAAVRDAEEGAEPYARALGRLFDGLEAKRWQVARDRLRGAAQWTGLQPHPHAVRLRMVREDPELHTWGLCERLLEVSRALVWNDHRAALEVAELALVVSQQLDAAKLGGERAADLRVAALGAFANCRRLVADFLGAQDVFREAWAVIKEGTADPLERARLLVLEASLWRDLGQIEKAVRQLEQAMRLYEQVGDTQQIGGVLIKMGDFLGDLDAGKGVELSRQALRLLDGGRTPRLELCARHNLSWYLAESGEVREALTLLDEARPLYREFPEPWIQLRLLWLEGLIARRLGDLAEAESFFEHLWQEFRARDSHHSLTLLSIDLVAIYVERGKLDAGLQLLSQVYTLLSEWGMHSEGLGIWMLMQNALGKRTAKAAVFREAMHYFRQAWHAPLHFKE